MEELFSQWNEDVERWAFGAFRVPAALFGLEIVLPPPTIFIQRPKNIDMIFGDYRKTLCAECIINSCLFS